MEAQILVARPGIRGYAKKIIDACGYRCFRIARMPFGIDERVDIRRLRGSNDIKLICDVGANIGNTAKRFAACWPKSKIYCFEPFPETYARLSNNTARLSSVTCINCALGSRPEIRSAFARPDSDSELNSLVPDLNRNPTSGAAPVDIQVTTIDQFCEDNRISHIDILKTDTEGFDLNVLSGATGMLRSQAIDFVFSEVGFTKSDVHHTHFPELLGFLEEHGLNVISLYDVCVSNDAILFCNALFMRRRGRG
jgi:FkbM family methyltransferase